MTRILGKNGTWSIPGLLEEEGQYDNLLCQIAPAHTAPYMLNQPESMYKLRLNDWDLLCEN